MEEKVNKDIGNDSFKEYYNLGDYYMKIGFTNSNNNNDELIITCYNTKLLDNNKYQLKSNMINLYESNKSLKKYEDIKDIYIMLIILIENNKYSIEKDSNDDNNSLILTIHDPLGDGNNIKFILTKDYSNSNNTNDYLNIISNEIKKLRITTGSEEINKLKQENIYMKNEIKLLKQMIFDELKITVEQFNDVFNTNIKDNKITELHLGFKKVNNEMLYYLPRINFDELIELRLYDNNISDISILSNVNFKKLEILGLSNNNITDISVLENVKFDNLKELWLYSNNISDISVFEKVKFNKLEKLCLRSNKISDISVFEKVKFYDLNKLWLYNNIISDISVFERAQFNNLETLSLRDNKIDKEKYSSLIELLKSKIKEFEI